MLQRSNRHIQQISHHHKQIKDCDYQYKNIRSQIITSNYFNNTSKSQRIVIQSWILKLDQAVSTSKLKKNRNNYAKVLNLMCECDVIIEPFTKLPPMNDLAKLSKHQINSLIDEVERLVRNQEQRKYNLSRQSAPALQNCSIVISQNPKNHSFKRSTAVDKLVNSQQASVIRPKLQYFSVLEQSKQSQNQIQKKEYFSQMKNRQNNRLSEIKYLNQSFNLQDNNNKQIKQPKHLVIKINTVNNKEANFNKSSRQSDSQNSDIDQSQNKSSFFINDVRLASEEQHTLKTENIEQDYTLHFSKVGQDSLDSIDLDNELSERCRDRDGVLNHQYFSWKAKVGKENNDKNFYKSKLKLTQSIPSKSLIKSKINTSSSFNFTLKSQQQKDGSISLRSQLSLLSQLQYQSSRNSQSLLKDISSSITNANS